MLSVLIVNWNTRDLLRACLASIYAHPPREPFEVIVVDNASSDGSAEMVRAEFPQVQVVGENSNLGYAKGNNSAFLRAKGDFLLTLNPDTEMLDDALQTSIDILREHPGYGCLGAKLIDRDGSTQASVRGFPTFRGIIGDLTGLARRYPNSRLGSYRLPAFDYEAEQPAPQPMGTFLLFRKEALQAIGDVQQPFDENFPIFFNEVDLLYRLNLAGFPTLYSPRVRILHLGGASTRQVKKSMIWESHKSLYRYFVKHYRRPWNAILFPLFAAVLYIGALLRAKGYHAGFRP